jgi:ubiquinone/menaquinone biosynthesis C-methylase UbiE
MNNEKSKKILNKYYKPELHPYRIYEDRILSQLQDNFTVVDAGCGANAPLLVNLVGRANNLIGVDLVKFNPNLLNKGMTFLNSDLAKMEIDDSSVDIVISRSVLEHIKDVENVYREIHRILRPGGKFIFLVPNMWDYVSILSYLIPNKLHKIIVNKFTGRPGEKTFDTYYESNTKGSIQRLVKKTGFDIISLEYLGQYPYMLEFNSILFYLGVIYDKAVSKFETLKYLRGWIMVELKKI